MQLAPDAQFIGMIRDGVVSAAVGFSHWTGHDIELSVAGDRATRGFLAIVFDYVFKQSGCLRCTIRTRASNAKAIKLAKRLGFQLEGTLRRGFGDEDALIFGLTRDDYHVQRWRKGSRGTRSPADH